MKSRYVLLIVALILASFNLRPSIVSISPVLASIQEELGMSGALASLLTSIPVLCMGIFSLIAVRLALRFGEERVLVSFLLVIGISTFMRAFSNSSLFLMVTAFFAGWGIAIISPLLSAFIKRHFPNQVTRMTGIFSVAMMIGASLAAGLTVPLQAMMHGSWRFSLAIWGVLAIIAVPFWLLIMKGTDQHKQSNGSKTMGRLPLRNKRAWLLTVLFGHISLMFYTMTAWLAPVLESMGYSKALAGAIITAYMLLQIPGNLLITELLQRFPSRFLWLFICMLMTLAGIMLIAFFSLSPWIAAIILGISAGGLFPLVLIITIEEATSPEEAGAWSGMTQAFGYIIGASGPFLVGLIRDLTGGFNLALIFLQLVCLSMMVIAYTVTAKKGKVINQKTAFEQSK